MLNSAVFYGNCAVRKPRDSDSDFSRARPRIIDTLYITLHYSPPIGRFELAAVDGSNSVGDSRTDIGRCRAPRPNQSAADIVNNINNNCVFKF